MAVITMINFKVQKKYRTQAYILGLNKILNQCGLDKKSKSLLVELVAVKDGLKNGKVKWNESTRSNIKGMIFKLVDGLPEDEGLYDELSHKTKKLCQRIRAKKHYKSTKGEMTKIELYASTRDRLIDLCDQLNDRDDDLAWWDRMELLADALEESI